MAYEMIKKIPIFSSTDKVWISWYDELKKVFGRKKANSLFSANWDAQNGQKSVANTSDLRKHLLDNGIDISGGFFGEAKDKAFGVAEYFGDFFTVGKYIGLGLASVLAISVGAFVFQLATRSSVRTQTIGVAKTIATKGMA